MSKNKSAPKPGPVKGLNIVGGFIDEAPEYTESDYEALQENLAARRTVFGFEPANDTVGLLQVVPSTFKNFAPEPELEPEPEPKPEPDPVADIHAMVERYMNPPRTIMETVTPDLTQRFLDELIRTHRNGTIILPNDNPYWEWVVAPPAAPAPAPNDGLAPPEMK